MAKRDIIGIGGSAELYETRAREYARHVEVLRAAVLASLDAAANDDAERARADGDDVGPAG